MSKTIHLLDDLTNSSVNEVFKNPECRIIICMGDASSEEEQRNHVLIKERGISVYTKAYDHDTVYLILAEIENVIEEHSEKQTLADLKERVESEEWLSFTDDFHWFGDSEVGFRYSIIDIDLFRRLGLQIEGTYAIYIEIAECNMPANYRDHIFDLFVKKVCSSRGGYVHSNEWRYKIIDNVDNNCCIEDTAYGRLYNKGLLRKGPDMSYLFTFAPKNK